MSQSDGIAFGKPFAPGIAIAAPGGAPALDTIETTWTDLVGARYTIWLDSAEGTKWGVYLPKFSWRSFYTNNGENRPSDETDPNDPAYDWSQFEQYQTLSMVSGEPFALVHLNISAIGRRAPLWMTDEGMIMDNLADPDDIGLRVPKWNEPAVQDVMINFLTAFAARANDYSWLGWIAFGEETPGGVVAGWDEGRARYIKHASDTFTDHMVFLFDSASVWSHLSGYVIGHGLDEVSPGAGSCGSLNESFDGTNNDCGTSDIYGLAQSHAGIVETTILSPARPVQIFPSAAGMDVVGENVRTDSPFGPLPSTSEQTADYDMNASVYLWYGSVAQRNVNVTDEFGSDEIAYGSIPNFWPVVGHSSFSTDEWVTALDRFGANGRKMIPALPHDWLVVEEIENTVVLNLGTLFIESYKVTPNITMDISLQSSLLEIESSRVTVSTTSADTTAPTIPTVSLVSVDSTQIEVSWTSSSDDESGVFGYNVYLDSALQGTVSINSYTFTGLSVDTEYIITVSAIDNVGNESETSDPLAVTTSSGAAYAAPEISCTAVSDTKINVRWNASELGSYVVYRDGQSVTYLSSLVYTDLGLKANTQYKYQIEAKNALGETSGKSKPFYITTDPRGGTTDWTELDDN